MPRKPVVTRTFEFTKCKIICLDLIKEKPYKETVFIRRTWDNKELLKKLREKLDSDKTKVVHIEKAEKVFKTFDMPEEIYLMNAIERKEK